MTVEQFEKALNPWFLPKNKTKIISKNLHEIKFLLENISDVGRYSIIEFEDGSGFDSFSNVWHEKDRLQIGQEKFNQMEQTYKEYFELSPTWLLGFYNACNAYKNFIAINSSNVKIEDFSEGKKHPMSMDLGKGLLLIYPKGSTYNLDGNSRKDLILCLKDLKI